MQRKILALLLTLTVLFAAGCAPAADFVSELTGELAAAFVTSPSASAEAGAAQKTASPAASQNASASAAGQEASPLPAGGCFRYEDIPAYSGEPYVAVNGNVPFFASNAAVEIPPAASLGTDPGPEGVQSFEVYSELDELGRCGAAFASVGQDIMPTEKRGDIYEVRPTGWVQNMYDFVDGSALYNRCHLLGYQLTAENANELNLITGTRYMNTEGMLPFENVVADYVKETGNHVLYRVTPVFIGDELLARGVLMEARSVEDNGEGIEYCTFAYNVQPEVAIDYATGQNWLESESGEQHYVLNTGTMRFHRPECESVQEMNPLRREDYTGTHMDLIEMGYTACGTCRP